MHNMSQSSLPAWLLSGDVSIQYQTHRDLFQSSADVQNALRARIAKEGWGRRYLDARDNATGLWGGGIYSPKWVSTHYTLLALANLGIEGAEPAFFESSVLLLNTLWPDPDMGKKKNRERHNDTCVAAMVLSIACHAGIQSDKLYEIVDYILQTQFPDGGFNCQWDRGAQKSSLHTTLSVLEAFRDYLTAGYAYRAADIMAAIPAAQEFILYKRLFRSVRTGEVIDEKMLMLSYPCRWKYDILRCLCYFASVNAPWDPRMEEALALVLHKRRADGRWPVQHRHAGLVFFDMEKTGGASRMNTLRVLRVLKAYRPELYEAAMR